MYRLFSIMILIVVVSLSGCGHGRMVPGRDARTVVGAPTAAVSTENGVRLTADSVEWRDKPEDLALHVTPLKVRIVNHSGKPIRVLYQEFALEGADGGHVYRPLPILPFEKGPAVESGSRGTGEVVQPMYASDKFFIAARYQAAYPTLMAWPSELPRDDALYQRQYKAWERGLPTREMERVGLPEGVLADGGEVAGFLFFQNVTDKEKRLHFKADLDEGDSDEAVATVDIPFRVE